MILRPDPGPMLPFDTMLFSAPATHYRSLGLHTRPPFKVKRDGSGVVHVRDFRKSTNLGFSFGGSNKTDKADDSKPDLPGDAELAKVARELGKGVSVESVFASKNDAGWNGFEVLFAFDKIDDLTIGSAGSLMDLGKKESDSEEESKANTSGKMKDEFNFANNIRFELNEGILIVHQTLTKKDHATRTESPTKDPFANKPKGVADIGLTSSMMEGFVANALKDARFGAFIELEGGIGQTNALYHDDSQVTLMKAVLGPMIEEKAKLEGFSALSRNLQGSELRKASQDLVETIDGLDIDMTETITIAFASDDHGHDHDASH